MGCVTSKKQSTILPLRKVQDYPTTSSPKGDVSTKKSRSPLLNTPQSTISKLQNQNPSFSDLLPPQQDTSATNISNSKNPNADVSPIYRKSPSQQKSILDSIHEQIQIEYEIEKEKREKRLKERAATMIAKQETTYQIRVNGELVADSSSRNTYAKDKRPLRSRARTETLGSIQPRRQYTLAESRETASSTNIRARKTPMSQDNLSDSLDNSRQSSLEQTRIQTPERVRQNSDTSNGKNLLLQVPLVSRYSYD